MKTNTLFSLIAVAGGLALTAACAEPADDATETEADAMSVEETTEDTMAEGEEMAEDAMAEGEEMAEDTEEAMEEEMTEEEAAE